MHIRATTPQPPAPPCNWVMGPSIEGRYLSLRSVGEGPHNNDIFRVFSFSREGGVPNERRGVVLWELPRPRLTWLGVVCGCYHRDRISRISATHTMSVRRARPVCGGAGGSYHQRSCYSCVFFFIRAVWIRKPRLPLRRTQSATSRGRS